MNRRVRNVLSGCFYVLLSGCMHTVTGNGGRNVSPDGRFRLMLVVHGASAKAYDDRTNKRVYVWVTPIGTNTPASGDNPAFKNAAREIETPIFSGKYIFRAADLSWNINWPSPHEVDVEFIDYGDGEDEHDLHKSITNHVAQLRLIQSGNVFVEKK